MTTPTLDTETLSTCIRHLEDVFVKLRHPQGSYVPSFVFKKLQQGFFETKPWRKQRRR